MAGACWSSLPADLLRLVSDCLTSERDLIHVRQVCSHWRSSAPLLVAPYRPWVVATRICFADPQRQVPVGDYSLWLLRGLRRIQLAGPPGLPCCCGTPRGWLALADDEPYPTRLVLWEPRSGSEIQLPPLADVIQVFLSADPVASAPSGWMAVATQSRRSGFYSHNLFFWRPGDAAWSAVAEVYADEQLQSVAFHGGNMYCTDSSKSLAVYDLNLGTTGSPPVLLRGMYIGYQLTLLCNRRCGKRVHGARAAHLVTCNGELLLVVLFNYPHPSFAEVYRPKNLLMPSSDLELGERVMDLGGYSLFLGRGDAFALAAHELPASAIRQNCIYYAVHSKHNVVSVFDLETDVFEKIPFPQEREGDPRNECWSISWFCPKRPILKKQQDTETFLDDDHLDQQGLYVCNAVVRYMHDTKDFWF